MEKIDILAFTGLADTQQNKAILEASLRCNPLNHTALQCECLHGMLSIVVIPWDIVEFYKSKHFIAIFL